MVSSRIFILYDFQYIYFHFSIFYNYQDIHFEILFYQNKAFVFSAQTISLTTDLLFKSFNAIHFNPITYWLTQPLSLTIDIESHAYQALSLMVGSQGMSHFNTIVIIVNNTVLREKVTLITINFYHN